MQYTRKEEKEYIAESEKMKEMKKLIFAHYDEMKIIPEKSLEKDQNRLLLILIYKLNCIVDRVVEKKMYDDATFKKLVLDIFSHVEDNHFLDKAMFLHYLLDSFSRGFYHDQRFKPRYTIKRNIKIVSNDGKQEQALLQDLSREGFCLSCSSAMHDISGSKIYFDDEFYSECTVVRKKSEGNTSVFGGVLHKLIPRKVFISIVFGLPVR